MFGATPDGSKVFFSSGDELTDDATGATGQGYLYEYDFATNHLRLIATDPGFLAGWYAAMVVSANGETLVAQSSHVLATNANAAGDVAQAGGTNDYVFQPDNPDPSMRIRFLAQGGPVVDGIQPGGGGGISPNGRYVLMASSLQLSSVVTNGMMQIYLYDTTNATTTCVSCGGSGPLQNADAGSGPYGPTDSGQVEFGTTTGIDPHDTNGVEDAYLWENGRAYLLTSGKSPIDSWAVGMSADATDVFVATTDALVPTDIDDDRDIYDVRVNGGFPVPPAPAPECVGGACQGNQTPAPDLGSAGSVTFTGPGNVLEKAPATAPTFTVSKITAAQQRAAANSGRLKLTVQVGAAGRLSGVVSAKLGKRAATKAIARVSKSVGKAGKVTLTLTLSRAARGYLAKTGSLPVVVQVTYSKVKGAKTARFTLKHAVAKKKRSVTSTAASLRADTTLNAKR